MAAEPYTALDGFDNGHVICIWFFKLLVYDNLIQVYGNILTPFIVIINDKKKEVRRT